MFDPIKKIRQLITMALVKAIDDTTAIQLLKLKLDDIEVMEGIEHLQNYGFTSHPPKESEAIVAQIGGSKENLIALIVESAANRVKDLIEGESAFYSKFGQLIKHKEDGTTEINSGKLIINCDIEINGNAKAIVDPITGFGVDLVSHFHPYTDNGVAMNTGPTVPS